MVLGLGGLGNGWRVAARVWGAPPSIGEALALAAAAVWFLWFVFYALKWAHSPLTALSELRPPVQAFFVALVPVATLMASVALAPHLPLVAWAMFVAGIVGQICFSAWAVGGLW